MKKLVPDFKTLADFRKDNIDSIKVVFQEFVYLCKSLDLYGANSKSNNLNEKTAAQRLKQTEEKIAQYLKELDSNDVNDSAQEDSYSTAELKEKISQLEEKK